ncbi:MAG TPA: 2-hydroxyacid dehydrogenase [Xanthobacteraceae bacterium]|jgi:lactate dehydrogenase-like 2-hydroxyacid dehydrogenase
MTIDVLSIGSFPEATNAELANRFAVTRHPRRPAPDVLNAELRTHIRAIATEANHGADRALIAALPKLEVIAVFGVGTDLIDLAAARERNVPVTNTPGILTEEVADLAIGLMLASARQILFADRYVRDGSWASKGPIPLGRGVGGKTMGVVGLGGIGRAIADRGAAFRMRVIYSGPRRKADAPYEYVADPVELARRSDYLMVACKGGPETYHLVSAAVIDALGPKGTLINVARGSVVDERALVAALAEGRLGHAALDVFESEPHPRPPLLQLPNVIVQPHHGSATVETRTAIGQLMIDNLCAHFAGRPLLTPVR